MVTGATGDDSYRRASILSIGINMVYAGYTCSILNTIKLNPTISCRSEIKQVLAWLFSNIGGTTTFLIQGTFCFPSTPMGVGRQFSAPINQKN